MSEIPAVLITGASTGIGATYAERFARRGHDLVLVARDVARMEALSSRLRQETGVKIDIIKADLTQTSDLAQVETRLRDDARIGILVNNAGLPTPLRRVLCRQVRGPLSISARWLVSHQNLT